MFSMESATEVLKDFVPVKSYQTLTCLYNLTAMLK